ncbi:MAG: hypothetical protein CO186_08150 [Zetaproteobacteria bacterium CG_4_9_14_3_um_filter_49_83]|nr:MAG: hypothetical protein AUJ56_08360 [Zetaproteobacteria bacterium CG1_02_49_23]PIQ34063.1 MAG: hypothetical protein COW62_03190 [Zetaproteobacteria bacterium CG17_big_fil_post_rev_8_21_14_2_50_50_13]PIV29143.1 MAG: hypothetical protein COS35_13650 [Zetaproteobacteria bacterium CG02_land_8_20_14_3_00_50_9]PIY55889.1 MAG: hypothetical protein COZ00_07150 [Zetaproteobacteria bacterium CG_4_10_14_0_8_um_filter_49_80]PJA35019.1 MAG: hypothetical protein CO186_08150 [Zetaproteobacteria bacterium
MTIKNVAIIGGGVSGLGTAYFLNKAGVNVTVYESVHHVGGNCRTVPVKGVGQAITGNPDPLNRWVDLGVNDFNKNSYTKIVAMLDELGVPYAPLEDTISYSGTGNGSTIPDAGYTMDKNYGNTIPDSVAEGARQFASYVSNNIDEFLTPRGKFYNATMGEFLADDSVVINPDFINYNLYPHINAMYFASGIAPADMPARMVIHYFNLQEGYGTGQHADRMYWVNGSQSWIQALKQYLLGLGVTIYVNTTAQIYYADNGVRVTSDHSMNWELFDQVVLAVQAWQLPSVYQDSSQVPDYIHSITEAIRYSDDEVVVHASPAELPANVSAWRTYNVNMYEEPNQGQPYRMSYVVNRHQNDLKNDSYNNANNPLYFCTLNPANPIPDSAYLLGPKSVGRGCTMFNFYHTILDMNAQKCQDEFIPEQQGKNYTWLVGGYTCGTGLQEECWESARNIVAKMLNPSHEFDHIYNHEKQGRDAIPLHIRNRLTDS